MYFSCDICGAVSYIAEYIESKYAHAKREILTKKKIYHIVVVNSQGSVRGV